MRAAKSEWLRHRAECERAYAVEFIFTIVLPLSDRCKCGALYLTPAVDVRMWPISASPLHRRPVRHVGSSALRTLHFILGTRYVVLRSRHWR